MRSSIAVLALLLTLVSVVGCSDSIDVPKGRFRVVPVAADLMMSEDVWGFHVERQATPASFELVQQEWKGETLASEVVLVREPFAAPRWEPHGNAKKLVSADAPANRLAFRMEIDELLPSEGGTPEKNRYIRLGWFDPSTPDAAKSRAFLVCAAARNVPEGAKHGTIAVHNLLSTNAADAEGVPITQTSYRRGDGPAEVKTVMLIRIASPMPKPKREIQS